MEALVRSRVPVLLLASLGLAAMAQAQNFSYAYRTSASSTLQQVTPNSDITAPPTSVGLSSTVTLVITNGSASTWTLDQAMVTGSAFKLTLNPSNTPIPSNATTLLSFTFTPASPGNASGTLGLSFSSSGQSITQNFFLAGTGQQPNFITSYILQPTGNQVAIANGGTLAFPGTNLNAASSATFIIANNGTGPGVVNSVTVSGQAFRISGLTLMPATVQPSSSIQFTITFTPTARGTATGALDINIAGTGAIAMPLSGTGVGASLTYTAILGSQSSGLTPGNTLTLPSTNLGSSTSAAITITNGGDAPATIGGVNVLGNGFTLSNVPTTPATIAAGSSFTFTLVFKPTASGAATGTLIVDSVQFPISAVGIGASLTYSSVIGGTTTALAADGTVVFPNTNVGATSTISIVVNNAGNAPTTVSGVSVSGSGFSLPSLPQLPVTLNAGDSVQFNVAFSAATTSNVTGVLQIDSFGINLRGNGNPPPSLSKVSFGTIPTTATALQQPAVSLALAQAYPMDLTGKLTLTFASDSFADDPNIQFATGGRTVSFTIPANTTDAVFGSSKQVQFQSGTVSGTIQLTASFSVAAVDVTPTPAPAAQVVVAPAPPVIRNVQIGTRTASSFELLITGLSTPRQVSQINLTFTPASGGSLQTTNLSINTDAPFSSWFQSQSGVGFGSQFTASVIVNVTGDVSAVQSVSVVASNSKGNSSAVSATLN
jgi:Abnormal spindle-like microcephaly-assoc'd, ASPM-SPD-2-Hydin